MEKNMAMENAMEDIRFSVWKMDLVLRGGMIVS